MYGEPVDFVDGEKGLVISSSVVDTYDTGICFGAKGPIYCCSIPVSNGRGTEYRDYIRLTQQVRPEPVLDGVPNNKHEAQTQA